MLLCDIAYMHQVEHCNGVEDKDNDDSNKNFDHDDNNNK